MFRSRFSLIGLPAIALGALLLTASPSPAQYRGLSIGFSVGRGYGYGYPYYGGPYTPSLYPGYYYRTPYPYYYPYSRSYAGLNYYYGGYRPYGPYYGAVPDPIIVPQYYGTYSAPPPRREEIAPEPAPLSDTEVQFNVRVPENAEVWINDSKTTQTGVNRFFVSSDLTPGKSYTYVLRAKWTDNGQEFDRTKRVKVQGGEHRHIEF